MPGWNDILVEIQSTPAVAGISPFDQVRRKYLAALSSRTGRHTILYASRWLQGLPPGTEAFASQKLRRVSFTTFAARSQTYV